jgi:signal peptidase I
MNFPLILFLATVVTGAVALADRWFFKRSRAANAREPWWIEYPKSFFPVLLIVFLLRSFVAEPFKIPSSSMRPTLDVGDFILVNKFAYGLRLPILEQKIVPTSDPQRGDVVVFRYPLNPSQDFIKRVIGLPGDTVVYKNKQITVNGLPWTQQSAGTYSYLEGLRFETMEQFAESVAGRRPEERALRGRRSDAARGEPRPGPSVRRKGQLRLQFRRHRLYLQGSSRTLLRDGRQSATAATTVDIGASSPTITCAAARSSSGSTGTTSPASRSSGLAAAFDKGDGDADANAATRVVDDRISLRCGSRHRRRHGRLPGNARVHRILFDTESARAVAQRHEGFEFRRRNPQRVPETRRRGLHRIGFGEGRRDQQDEERSHRERGWTRKLPMVANASILSNSRLRQPSDDAAASVGSTAPGVVG